MDAILQLWKAENVLSRLKIGLTRLFKFIKPKTDLQLKIWHICFWITLMDINLPSERNEKFIFIFKVCKILRVFRSKNLSVCVCFCFQIELQSRSFSSALKFFKWNQNETQTIFEWVKSKNGLVLSRNCSQMY